MPYERQTFVDHETKLSAAHMEHIEDGISEAFEKIEGDLGCPVLYSPQTLTEEQKAQARENIGVPEAIDGNDGATFTPSVSSDGTLSWSNNKGLVNPAPVDIKGAPGTSVTVKSVSESSADGGSNVVTFSDGKTVTIKNGRKGSPGDAAPQQAVLYIAQTLDDVQKSQARTNIEAVKIVKQAQAPTDTSALWIDPTDDATDGTVGGETPLYQYVSKSTITDGYFWYFDDTVALPYKYKYDNYSTVEPIVLAPGTYYFSPLMIVYTWIKVGDGPVQEIDHYYEGANTTGFVMTIPETSTIWLGYHNPQISAVTPYVINDDKPLPVGEYFEGKEPAGLESFFDYGVFVEAYVKNCELVANELTGEDIGAAKGHYTGVKMDGHIVKQMCKAKFFPNAAVALVTTDLGSRMVSDVTFGSVHLVFSMSGCSVGVFDTKDKLRSIDYFSYTITAGEELTFGFDINEATNTLTIYLPNGTTKTVTDTAVSACNGQYAIWEHFSNTSEGTFASCRITKFYCKDASGEVLEDDFRRFDGAIGVAPTGQTYRQFTSFNLNNRDFR